MSSLKQIAQIARKAYQQALPATLALLIGLWGTGTAAAAQPTAPAALHYPDYALQPRQVASDTWVIEGVVGDFSQKNGCNIINTGFIVTSEGVVVINTGPSFLYGKQQKEAIARVTSKPIVRVLNLNLHPDYFFGNQAFSQYPLQALPESIVGMRAEGAAYADNLYLLCGYWMKETEPTPAKETISAESFVLGGHQLELLAFAGHTGADLVVVDTSTGVVFTGGLVFSQRVPTTPHADLTLWSQDLRHLQGVLESLPVKVLVPSHGPVAEGKSSALAALIQTRNWLQWLEQSLRQAADNGQDMSEVLQAEIPNAFQDWAVLRPEYQRSVFHFYPEMETKVLQK